ncbi:DUF3592 domain-containing protein [Aquimarina macrocephali]|uniref:DUF3592 domain-containing protein n=1 Tax=Aquimarina macrocephali TaxID=666563 RepID=UPI003F67DB0D
MYKIVFLLASIAVLLLSTYLYLKYKRFKKNAIQAKGEVTGFTEKIIDSFGEKTLYYFPIIRFVDIKGNKHEVESDVGEGSLKKIIIGNTIRIVYNRNNPNEIITKENHNLILPIALFILFVIFLAIAVL